MTNVRERGAPASGLATSLEVITPDGVRHPVWSVDLADDGEFARDFDLADWRPELHTALLRSAGDDGRDRVVAYHVTTGRTRDLRLPRRAISAALDPDGTGILMTLSGRDPTSRTVSQTWGGRRTRLPGTGGHPMTSVDGRILVTPTAERHAWSIVDLRRRMAKDLLVPGFCSPIRWLDHDSVLTSCYADAVNTLRSVHLGGGSTVLGPTHRPGHARVHSYGDAVRAAGSRWYLAWSRRGELARGTRPNRVTRVPRTSFLMHLSRTPEGRLLLARSDSTLEAPSFRAVLEVLDPTSRTKDVLVRLAPGQAWRSVIGATEVRHWNP
ncbi:hypothetical protein EUA06_19675 [Nocardioides glacieisoli]|uniref:Uncharacterized protein n=1 Tax=Nocardioides glacieisoli TaxID=1168730 RepID=A0A4Q2RLM9_9ACTN|nr:hypothetical protein [Nocardioides glacieisoli]RYB88714.1 hypothetical protein EUA06_19675 [Nocardioides glacieisoli]